MHHDPAIERFYTTRAWRSCKESFLESRGRICEICRSKGLIIPATQVHHKVHLTPENVKDPRIALNHANLMALCDECHRAQHTKKRWRCDELGHVAL